MVSFFSRLRGYVQRAERWYLTTPDRALDDAYDAALMIQAIENEHFEGQKISPEFAKLGRETFTYFEQELNKHLKTIRLRLSEFRLSRSTLNVTNPNADRRLLNTVDVADYTTESGSSRLIPSSKERSGIALEKLRFIDEVLTRYTPVPSITISSQSLVPLQNGERARSGAIVAGNGAFSSETANLNGAPMTPKPPDTLSRIETMSDKTGVLPRSILGTLNRLKRELDPNADYEVMQDFQAKRQRTKMAIRFLLTLIAVPLLVQVAVRNVALSDSFVAGQWLNHQFTVENPAKIFLNGEMTEEALRELTAFEEKLKFETMLKETLGLEVPEAEAREELVRDRVKEIAVDFSHRSANAIKNWIADLSGLVAFAVIVSRGRREIEAVKGFMDEVVYGLSDSAKAFIIILFTDIFVGFHSPHGWEVLLEGIADHLGIPPSHDFIFLFIATFPVILDTIFKYWIFRYLNRLSPSAVATYKEMNE